MSGWYIDPTTGKRITLGSGETLAGTGLVGGDFTLIESGSGYRHTSWLDKFVSGAGKAASVWAGGGSSSLPPIPGATPFESMPKISINKPPEALAPYMLDLTEFNTGAGGLKGGIGAEGEAAAVGSSGLNLYAIAALVVLAGVFLGFRK